MSHEEYWTWLYNKWYQIQHGVLAHQPEALQVAVFVKSLPPYDIWLAQSSPKGSESPVEPSHAEAGDSPNLSDKASEIRKELYNAYEKSGKYVKDDSAFADFVVLCKNTGDPTLWKAIENINDSELVKWNTKHEVFV